VESRRRTDRRPRRPQQLAPAVFLSTEARAAYWRAGALAYETREYHGSLDVTGAILAGLRAAERASGQELQQT
jgi:hypothetical protein